MRTRLTALLVLLLGSVALGQSAAPPPKNPAEELVEKARKQLLEAKKPSALEELLAQALRDNPDVRVADAKVREAEAELNRARLLVIQKVVAHQHTVETLESGVKTAEARYMAAEAVVRLGEAQSQRIAELIKKGAIAREEVDAMQAKLEQAKADVETAKAAVQAAKADLAKAKAELPYLLGKGNKEDKTDENVKHALDAWLSSQQDYLNTLTTKALYARSIEQAQAAWEKKAQPQGTVADKLRKALDTPTSVKFSFTEVSLDDLLEFLKQKVGTPMVATLPSDLRAKKYNWTRFSLDNVPLGAAFQAVEDVAGVQFAVRDYGILVSDKLPSGVLRLHDFWKSEEKPKSAPAKPPSSGRNPPPGKIEGKVTEVDAAIGLVQISVGSDAGLASGHTLEVYRLSGDKGPRYLGTVRIEKTSTGMSVGKFTNKLNAPVEVGDRVSSQFFVD